MTAALLVSACADTTMDKPQLAEPTPAVPESGPRGWGSLPPRSSGKAQPAQARVARPKARPTGEPVDGEEDGGTLPTMARPGQSSAPATSVEQVRTECWMRYEKDRKRSLDERAKLVEKCTADKIAGRLQ